MGKWSRRIGGSFGEGVLGGVFGGIIGAQINDAIEESNKPAPKPVAPPTPSPKPAATAEESTFEKAMKYVVATPEGATVNLTLAEFRALMDKKIVNYEDGVPVVSNRKIEIAKD